MPRTKKKHDHDRRVSARRQWKVYSAPPDLLAGFMGREKRSAKRMGETGVWSNNGKRGEEWRRKGKEIDINPTPTLYVVAVAPKLASSHDVKRHASR